MRELEEQMGLEAALEIQSMDAHYVEQSQSRVILPGGDIKISSTAEAIARAIAPAERVFSRDGSV